jgi:hypothetical protein
MRRIVHHDVRLRARKPAGGYHSLFAHCPITPAFRSETLSRSQTIASSNQSEYSASESVRSLCASAARKAGAAADEHVETGCRMQPRRSHYSFESPLGSCLGAGALDLLKNKRGTGPAENKIEKQ